MASSSDATPFDTAEDPNDANRRRLLASVILSAPSNASKMLVSVLAEKLTDAQLEELHNATWERREEALKKALEKAQREEALKKAQKKTAQKAKKKARRKARMKAAQNAKNKAAQKANSMSQSPFDYGSGIPDKKNRKLRRRPNYTKEEREEARAVLIEYNSLMHEKMGGLRISPEDNSAALASWCARTGRQIDKRAWRRLTMQLRKNEMNKLSPCESNKDQLICEDFDAPANSEIKAEDETSPNEGEEKIHEEDSNAVAQGLPSLPTPSSMPKKSISG